MLYVAFFQIIVQLYTWIRNRIQITDPDPDSEYGSGFRIRIRIQNTDPDPQSLTVFCLSSYLEVLPHHHLCQLVDGLVLLDLLLPDHK